MIDLQLALKLIHVLGAAVLFGTGLGIAFFMWMAHLTGDPAHIARTARVVVIADALFTASAVVVQPVTGLPLSTWSAIRCSIPGSCCRWRCTFSSAPAGCRSCGSRRACAAWP